MKKNSQIKMLVLLLVALLLSGCAGPTAWTITEVLVTSKEETDVEYFEYKIDNCCGLSAPKSPGCSAGTSTGVELTLGGSIGAAGTVTFDPSIGKSFGFETVNSDSMELAPPPPGYMSVITMEVTYIYAKGSAMAESSKGETEKGDYSFKARCSLKAVGYDTVPCEEKCAYEPAPSPTPEVIPTATPVPTATTVPTPTISPPAITNFVFCSGVCNGKNATTEYRYGTNYIYANLEHQNIPDGAKYERIWTMEGIEWVRYECEWNDDLNGQPIHVELRDLKGLHDGNWTMTIKVDGKVIQSGSVKVSGGETYLETAPPQNTCFETPPPDGSK